jgi:hypothetical protein
VLVEALPAGIRRIEPFYQRLSDAMSRLHGRYDDRQLALVMEYLIEAVDLGAAHVAWLQSQHGGRTGSSGRERRGTRARRPAPSRRRRVNA